MMRFKRGIAAVFIGLVLMGGGASLAPRPAYALFGIGDIVIDPTNLIQNTISAVANAKTLLNPIFYRIAQAAIQSLTRSTVNWINNGFHGSPAFATDLKSTLLNAADAEAGRFIGQLTDNLSINSPFKDEVAQNLLAAYYLSTSKDGFFIQNPYTLSQVSPDDRAFLRGDFSKGGFRAWLATSLNEQNNHFGLEDLAQRAFNNKVAAVQGQIHEELGWGNGFLSFRKCDKKADVNDDSLNLSEASDGCLSSHIETPGSVIASQLNKSLGLGADSLVQADSFDEIVNALISQLMNQVLGAGGLRGVSKGSSSTGGRSYFDQPSTVTSSASAGVSVVSSFTQILDQQVSQLQTYASNWQAINAAALAAKTALASSTCTPNADSVIASQVTPVLTQAATVIGSVPSIITELERIRSSALDVVTSDTTEQLTALQQANADYQNILSTQNFPSLSDMNDATEQAQDTGTANPSSLLTQMSQLAAQAKCST
jgi:hypothetical protein